MSTRSSIAVRHGTEIKAVYCHWDGYVDHVGRVLHTHYQAGSKVDDLIALGDLSSLAPNIGVKHAFDTFEMTDAEAEAYKKEHSDSCTFYTRDRGENTPFSTYLSEREWIRDFNDAGVEYYYLYDSGVWYVDKGGYNDFVPLSHRIQSLDLKEKTNSQDLVI
jgi:hypothetical protein